VPGRGSYERPARGARMISILGLDLDACMIRFLVSISMHAAGRAAARAAATAVFSPFRDLAAMHTGGGSGRSAEAGDGSECSLSMRMRLSCHAVTIMRMRLGEGGVLERHVPIYSLRSEAIPYSNQIFYLHAGCQITAHAN
jgi:hypothetical protein